MHSTTDLTRRCVVTGESFLVTEAEQDLLRRIGERNFWLGEPLPFPKVKPCEMLRQIFGYGNIAFLSRDRSALSGDTLLSRYPTQDRRKLLTSEEFWSDEVDNCNFGQSYDFDRRFFEQFSELLQNVFYLALSRTNAENSEYTNAAQNVKNCYLCFSVIESQDCLYCIAQYNGTDNVDCVGTYRSQFCYASRDLDGCYECHHCADCWSCQDCFGCSSCRSCKNCFGCAGLERREFCVFNSQYSKHDYESFVASLRLSSHSGRTNAIERCRAYTSSLNFAPFRRINAEQSSGAYIFHSSDIFNSYHVINSQQCGHLLMSKDSRNCWKGWDSRAELCYAAGAWNGQNISYSYSMIGGEDLHYSYFLFNCASCFGCAMLKNKSYCIFNKQYSKSEYFALLPRIVAHMKKTGEWGSFLPPSQAPHLYNESFGAQHIEQLPDDELARRGYRMGEPAELFSAVGGIDSSLLPDEIDEDQFDSYAGKVICCETSKQNFNLQRAEIEFYRRFSIPVPHKHWRVRLNELVDARDRMPEDVH